MRSDRTCLARESRQVEDDEEVDLAFIRAAVREQPLELGPVHRLRALALFLEPLEDLEAFTAAVLFADPELGREARFSVCSLVLTRM